MIETAYGDGEIRRTELIAQCAIAKGYPYQDIADMTGLSLVEVETLASRKG